MEQKRITYKILILIILIVIVALDIIVLLHSRNNQAVCQEEAVYTKTAGKKIEDIKKYENIVFLGDSITDFYPIESIYKDLPIVKSGVSGYTTNDILDRMDSMVYQYNPTSVFLLIGTNDIMFDGEATRDSTIENIEKILSNIKENRQMAEVYLESIYPVNYDINPDMVRNRKNEIIKDINTELEEYCKKNDVVYIDMYDELSDDEGKFARKYTNDGLHPNDLAYARISQVRSAYIYDVKSK